jgi:hypothetical protein
LGKKYEKANTMCPLGTPRTVTRAREAEGSLRAVETYVDDDHLVRCLLKCRECGALYFHEFYEWIDWEDGNDPQYSTYIPVETDAEIEALKTASPFGLLGFSPRLQRDFPKDAAKPTVRWVGK